MSEVVNNNRYPIKKPNFGFNNFSQLETQILRLQDEIDGITLGNVEFKNISGQATDNESIKSELDKKVDKVDGEGLIKDSEKKQIESNKTDITSLKSDKADKTEVTAEAEARAKADEEIGVKIDNIKVALNEKALKSNLDNEIEARESKDEELTKSIEECKTSCDTKISAKMDKIEGGNGIEIAEGKVNLKVDGTTVYINSAGLVSSAGGSGGSASYIAGTGIDILGNNISVKIDNNTIKTDALGNLIVSGGSALEIIDDTKSSTTTVWSSALLKTKFDALSGTATIVVVQEQPTSPQENTIYYIKRAGVNIYDIRAYMKNEEGELSWINMGQTSIDLSTYYTKTEIDAMLIKKADADNVYKKSETYSKNETYSNTETDELITEVKGLVNTERLARIDDITSVNETINNEVADRKSGDENLQKNINEVTAQIETLKTDKQNVTDETLETDSKTVVGAINEINKKAIGDVFDMIYPVGSIYISIDGTTPKRGTWTKLSEGVSLWNTSSGGGEILEGQLPNPNIALENDGKHTHERGTMDIIGNVGAFVMDASSYISGNGAFYISGTPRTRSWSGASGNEIRSIGFQASKNWTGATSENGEHSHTVNINNTQYIDGTVNRPTSIAVTMYQRTA